MSAEKVATQVNGSESMVKNGNSTARKILHANDEVNLDCDAVSDVIANRSPDGTSGETDNRDVASGLGESMRKPAGLLDDKLRKRVRKLSRSNSKDGLLGVAGTPNFVAPHRKWKNSRRSRNVYGRGLPKKGGAGGKGVWGKPGTEEVYDELDEDPNDPNFDIDAYNSMHNVELKEIVPQMTEQEIVKKMESIILEYYEHGDTHEVADAFEDLLTLEMKPLVTKTVVGIAFDHKQSQRELTSVLISDLYGRIVTREDICAGFDLLLANLPDIMLDTPDAPHLLGNFIARAVADDCIPPKYAYESEREDLDLHARGALVRATTLLSMHDGWGHLDNVWGVGGALRPVQTITSQMSMLLQEYLLSRDVDEAQRSIKELEVPHFHHELIYEAIIMTLEALNESTEAAICDLFRTLDSTCIVTPEQTEQGFRRVYDDMADIVLDIPLAYSILDRFIQRCERAGSFLSETLIKDIPTRGRKRFVSEGDGGLIKQGYFHRDF
ncbi:programmed cell death protein 4 [Anopheles bellator]|uniref:programmed cell death protein 4 n=1 Tax=Anopheles bellator TaxID=139047 RepID=UPI0026478958|nr:programmed cell death protein 4 [Anopheles bellator]XP_058064510.1 programmed cell death protein 4 [Anopheles bellator]XP_058064511.1 programmed cell death protein 4 [Anopheles bellator]XP_058064512.1 programmed cell death protein 4 [Anopheles bellator]XP_058064513.1 programmed cell death protein 4 [Anopheles bellator]XP_058064515.1 programmed cell death protein 4 [Anopheles bellator]XP_058064516.1 programmed cell death protein 4 [Anopheles bellator]XP_058064517.1 programmed cell death pr